MAVVVVGGGLLFFCRLCSAHFQSSFCYPFHHITSHHITPHNCIFIVIIIIITIVVDAVAIFGWRVLSRECSM